MTKDAVVVKRFREEAHQSGRWLLFSRDADFEQNTLCTLCDVVAVKKCEERTILSKLHACTSDVIAT